MSKDDNRLIIILLLMIIILATILSLKIHTSNKYNKFLYNNIYKEYNNYFSIDDKINEENIVDQINNSFEQNINNNTNEYEETSNVIGKIEIPSLQINYPILKYTTDELLKIAPTKLCGPNINEKGNLCIIGHNYHNSNFFSKLDELNIGDKIVLTNANNKSELTYVANKKYIISKKDLSVLNQHNNKEYELTLITCTNNKEERLIVKCNAVF